MADDVLLNKVASIERAVRRVREEHAGAYQRLSIEIVRQIIARHLDDFLAFARVLLRPR